MSKLTRNQKDIKQETSYSVCQTCRRSCQMEGSLLFVNLDCIEEICLLFLFFDHFMPSGKMLLKEMMLKMRVSFFDFRASAAPFAASPCGMRSCCCGDRSARRSPRTHSLTKSASRSMSASRVLAVSASRVLAVFWWTEIASRLEAIAIRLEMVGGHAYSVRGHC